jgi:hypothetical protein
MSACDMKGKKLAGHTQGTWFCSVLEDPACVKSFGGTFAAALVARMVCD